jgi:ATP-binding cassette subfamily F protein 3
VIEFDAVSYAVPGRKLLDGVSFRIAEGSRTGVIGDNGSGKTTLLRILLGQIPPDAGEVRIAREKRFGYLAQHPRFSPGADVFGYVAERPPALRELAGEMEALEARMEGERDPLRLDRMVERHRGLQSALTAGGFFEVEGRAEEILSGLGIRKALFSREINSLSGGEKNRVALARILCEDPEILVLDEPTNYLDIEMIEWLEAFLSAGSRTVIVSSHDRYFLNRVALACLELRDGTVHLYRGNYDAFALQREEEISFQLKRYQKVEEEISRELEFIRRNFYGQKARQAKAREKRVTRLEGEAVAPPPAASASPRIRFDQTQRGGEDVLRAEGLACGYGENRILADVSLHLSRGERVALLGPNGSGKTTLLGCLAGRIPPLAGEVHRGARTAIGWYDQEVAAIDSPRPLFDDVHDLVPRWEDQRVRDLLAAFLFRGDRIRTRIGDLSGGEKAKLALIRLILSGSNLLLLDEPTNHLDLHSRAALEEALLSFPETIVFVSHDRYFIERLAERILYIEDGEVREVIGSYPEYRELLRERRERETAAFRQERERARKRRAAAASPRPAERRKDEEKLLARITLLEADLRARQEEASRPEVFRSAEASRRLKREMEDLEQKIGELYREWEGMG